MNQTWSYWESQKLSHKQSLLYIQNMYLVNHHLCLISKSQNTATCFMLLCTASRIILSPAQFPCVHLSPATTTCRDSLSALSTPHIASAWDWSFPSPLGIADVSAALMWHAVHLDVSEIPAWHVPQVSRSPSKKFFYNLVRSFQSTVEN